MRSFQEQIAFFQYFYPDSLAKEIALPTPYIKEISFNGQPVFTSASDIVTLPAGAENVSLKLGALNLNINPVNYYSYKLKGVNEEWSQWSNLEDINYSNLKGGDYIFEFRAANKLFEWSETKTIPFIIEKKWTETIWFKLLLIALGLGLIFFPYWYRNRQLKREAEIASEYQKQINELQMNALQLQMNPHFVFNSINSINYFIIQNDRDKASNYLAKFSRLIRQILENSKSKLISLEQELEAINLYLEIEHVRFEGKFDFEIELDEDVQLSTIEIPPLIIQPYVENAIWHGLMHKKEPGQLLIQIQNAGDQVQCIIEDDGIGVRLPESWTPEKECANNH